MDVTPFDHQGPLPPDRVRGRDDLLTDLAERVTEHRVTALLGPRRFGKTSVLGRLARDLSEVSTVIVDLFGVASYDDLVARLASAMDQATPQVAQPAHDLAASAGVNLGVVRAQLTMAPKHRPDPPATYAALVRTLVELGQRVPLLIIFDEFQAITDVRGAAEGLRTELQHHYRRIGLLFAGSAPSAMRGIFARHDQPFFNQADLIDIEPLSLAAVHEIVTDGFEATGKDPGRVAALIYDCAGGHPQRTMRLADEVWRRTSGAPADEVWRDALEGVRRAEAAGLAAAYDDLEKGEQKVLRLVANSEGLFGAQASNLSLSYGGAAHARDRLLEDAKLLPDDEGRLMLTDPLLADWLRQRLPL